MIKPVTSSGKSWFDRVIVTKDGQKRKLKRLQPVGSSLALFLPKLWIELACHEDNDGRYWVEIEMDVNKITITGIKEMP